MKTKKPSEEIRELKKKIKDLQKKLESAYGASQHGGLSKALYSSLRRLRELETE